MSVILFPLLLLPMFLGGCGESATDTQSTGNKQEAELATFLPGKRIYFPMPMPGEPGVPTEPGESPIEELLRIEEQFNDLVGTPNSLSDAQVKPREKPASPEMVWQFEMDGTITMGVFSNGEIEFFEGQKCHTRWRHDVFIGEAQKGRQSFSGRKRPGKNTGYNNPDTGCQFTAPSFKNALSPTGFNSQTKPR